MTMKLIEHVEIGPAGLTSIDFLDIPQDFTDLHVKFSIRGTQGSTHDVVYFKCNSVAIGSGNYYSRRLEGNGSAANSYTDSAGCIGLVTGASSTANTFGNGDLYIPNYTSNSSYKSMSINTVGEYGGNPIYQDIVAGIFQRNDPVTSLSLMNGSSSYFVQYSSASLYGILAGSDGITVVS